MYNSKNLSIFIWWQYTFFLDDFVKFIVSKHLILWSLVIECYSYQFMDPLLHILYGNIGFVEEEEFKNE